eukprot:7203123-Heterocapsa_arctica.AAC.2
MKTWTTLTTFGKNKQWSRTSRHRHNHIILKQDEFSLVRSIGVSRLAGTPDILPTYLISNRADGWSTSKKTSLTTVVQGKPSFTIDYSVPCFLISPVFEAYKLLPRDIPGPFNNREVGDKLLTSSDTLSAVSYLATFLTMNQDPAVLAAHNNLLRARAFAINHKLPEEGSDPMGRIETSQDF